MQEKSFLKSRRSTKPVRSRLPSTNAGFLIVWLHKMAECIGGRGPDDLEAHYRRAWLLTQILEDYFRLRDRLGPKESLLWLEAEEPDVYAMFAEALALGADLAAIRRLVRDVTALAETSQEEARRGRFSHGGAVRILPDQPSTDPWRVSGKFFCL
jgi:hypothetical protein